MNKHILFSLLLSFCIYTTFAQPTVGVITNTADAFDGYTLIVPTSNKIAYLINNCGEVVNTWTSDYSTPAGCYLLENGDYVRNSKISNSTFAGGGTLGGIIERFDWDGNIQWTYTYSTNEVKQHHDIEFLPNGNVLLLAWELISEQEALDSGRDPNYLDGDLWVEHVVEIQPSGTIGGTIVWEWHLWDHIIQQYNLTKPNYGVINQHPELIDLNYVENLNTFTDWNHCNAIDYNEALDQIVISSRNFSEFWVIDHSTTSAEAATSFGGNSGKGGDLLYRWGNPQTYNQGTAADRKLFGQHDVQWIEKGKPNEGKFLIFNNGNNRTPIEYSTIEIVDPPIDINGNYTIANNAAFDPTSAFWTYTYPNPTDFYSQTISGAHQMPNGNVLAVEGRYGYAIEVDPAGNIVWEYVVPISFTTGLPINQGVSTSSSQMFRIRRYPKDYPAFECRDLVAGSPIEANPINYGCELNLYDFKPNYQLDANCITEVFTAENNLICLAGVLSNYTILIKDINGNLVQSICQRGAFAKIDLNLLASGVYYLSISNDSNGNVNYQTIVVQ